MAWLPDSEKKSDDMITRFDRIHERDRQTHTHRQTPHDFIAALMHSISSGKKSLYKSKTRHKIAKPLNVTKIKPTICP